MFRSALFLCIFGQAFHFGVGNEPSTFTLNDLMNSASAVTPKTTETGLTVQTGEEACEEHGYGKTACAGIGCCTYDSGECHSAVGMGACKATSGSRRRRRTGDSDRRRRSFADKMENVDWDQATNTIVDSMVREFFKKSTLQAAERECLDKSLGKFTGDVAGLVQSGVKALGPVIAPKEGKKAASLGSAVPLLLSGISDITDLVEVIFDIEKNCLEADGLALMKQAAHKMKNFTYVEHQLLANGADITKSLAKAVIAFQNERFSEFGMELGGSARKVILSTNNKVIQLPEGYATEEAIQKSSSGIAQGFFAKGSTLTITDLEDSRVDIKIALDECIADNDALFKDIFKGLWELVTEMVANKAQHQFANGTQTGITGTPLWVQELVLSLTRVPMALTRCNLLDSSTQDMLEEALQTLGSLRFNFQFPEDSVKADEATQKVANALIKFENKDYFGFGKELGKLMRELLLLAFPQDYSVDETGALVRQLTMAGWIRKQKRAGLGGPMLVFSGVAFALLMSAVAMKSFRVLSNLRTTGRQLITVSGPEAEEDDIETLE